MKYILSLILLSLFYFTKAQDNLTSNKVILDTIYSINEHGVTREPFFIEKYTEIEKSKWNREVYNIEGVLLAKGNIRISKKANHPTPGTFSLVGKWSYFNSKGEFVKTRNYGIKMKNQEPISKTIFKKSGYSKSVTIW